MTNKIKISAIATRRLNTLLQAADAYAFQGAAHPDAQDGIKDDYDRAVDSMRQLIARLETGR
jgi:hypothetical protein